MSETMNLLEMYDPLDFMGEGAFGEVYKALNKRTGEIVALKQVKNTERSSSNWLHELKMLRIIDSLDAESSNCIRMNNCFKSSEGDHFMEFEMLDRNVLEFMEKRDAPFSLKELRPMAKSLLVALESLRSVGVIHTDIKLENIMFVDQEAKPFKVKLIDFGVAEFSKEMCIGDTIQPLAYRAPEVTLGLPLSEAVDMWSLGCCLLECFLNFLPFSVESPYDHIKQITCLLGVPDAQLITRAEEGTSFFVQENSGEWRLKSISEYKNSMGEDPKIAKNTLELASDLKDVILNTFEFSSGMEYGDRMVFLDLLQKMLEVDPEKRITPAEALQHPFITMSHFIPALAYMENSKQLLDVPRSSDTSDSSNDEASGDENDSIQASKATSQTICQTERVTPEGNFKVHFAQCKKEILSSGQSSGSQMADSVSGSPFQPPKFGTFNPSGIFAVNLAQNRRANLTDTKNLGSESSIQLSDDNLVVIDMSRSSEKEESVQESPAIIRPTQKRALTPEGNVQVRLAKRRKNTLREESENSDGSQEEDSSLKTPFQFPEFGTFNPSGIFAAIFAQNRRANLANTKDLCSESSIQLSDDNPVFIDMSRSSEKKVSSYESPANIRPTEMHALTPWGNFQARTAKRKNNTLSEESENSDGSQKETVMRKKRLCVASSASQC